MSDNWLSTDAAINEVVAYAIKMSGGTMPLDIRCPDAEIEAKVKAHLKGKHKGSNIGTYVGKIDESITPVYAGDRTPVGKTPRRKMETAPDEISPEMSAFADEVEEWPRDPDVDLMIMTTHCEQCGAQSAQDCADGGQCRHFGVEPPVEEDFGGLF